MGTREELEVIIDNDGQVKVTVKGLPGKACLAHKETVQEIGQIIERELTDEYYRQPAKVQEKTEQKETVKNRRR